MSNSMSKTMCLLIPDAPVAWPWGTAKCPNPGGPIVFLHPYGQLCQRVRNVPCLRESLLQIKKNFFFFWLGLTKFVRVGTQFIRVLTTRLHQIEIIGGGHMKFRPLHDRILVERVESEEVTKGGIILPDTAKEKPQQGKVIAVGNGKKTEDGKLIPLEIKVGEIILFGKYSGSEIKIEGTEYLIMKEDDVLGIVE